MIDSLLRMQVFVAIYEEGSFTAAAKRENLTQSGVTQHVQKLEQYMGATLFVRRTGGRTKPTPLADAYYLDCAHILRLHTQSRSRASGYAKGLSGEVRVGLTPTCTRSVLTPTLSNFLALHPNVVVCITDAYTNVVMGKLRSGDLDFAVVPNVPPETGMRRRLLASMPEFLLSSAHAGHKLVHGKRVRLSELGPLQLVVPSKAQITRAALDAYLADSGAVVERMLEIDTAFGALDFVKNSRWQSISPAIVTLPDLAGDDFIVNPLNGPPISLHLYHFERTSTPATPAAAAFLAELSRQIDVAIDVVRAFENGQTAP